MQDNQTAREDQGLAGHGRLFYRSGGDVFVATLRETPAGIEVVSRARVGHLAASSLSPWDAMYDVSWDNKLFVASANEKGWQLVFAQNWLEEFRQKVSRP